MVLLDPCAVIGCNRWSDRRYSGSRMLVHLQQLAEARRQVFAAVRAVQRRLLECRHQVQGFQDLWETVRAQVAVETRQTVRAEWPQGWIGDSTGVTVVEVNRGQFLQRADETLTLLADLAGLYAEQAGRVDAQGIRKTARALRQVAPRAAEYHDIHETDAGRLELLAEQLEKYSEALIPPSFIAVLIVLAWITVTGVAIPLAFLPGLPGDSSKGWLLVAFCVGVVGLIAALGGQLSHLKRIGDIRWLRPEEYTQA